MCGITGFSGKGDRAILERMNDSLRHRGPDDSGLEIFQSGTKVSNPDPLKTSVGLAQRRLSIIDLSPAGHQPMSNEDGSVWIVFNGEIYNYKELQKLFKQKHVFKGKSDTEAIIHLYEEIGTEVFSKIHGMFAIAIYDKRTDKLILARDRMGKKPMYWGIHGGNLLFGSELKALIAHPSFKKEIDLNSLNKYLLYENIPTPASIFKNTYKLEPGTFLTWNGKEAKKTEFWRPSFLPKTNDFNQSLADLDKTLQSAVTDRLMSDVPLGIFLSGGLDSSAVAYYAMKANKGPIKTFSIGFEEKSFDESNYARQVAKHLGTEHFEKILPVNEGLKIIPEIGRLLDEPMADGSIIPTYLLSKFTREHVTVALGGDGGDELFCGYDPLLAHRFSGLYGMIPSLLRDKLIKPIANSIPTSHANISLDFKIKKFVNGFEKNHSYRNQRWLSAFDKLERSKLLKSEVLEQLNANEFEDIDRYLALTDSHEMYDELAMLYERMYMMDQVLVKADRASMMNSLEVRAPFLDTRVVDLANHMPASFKFKGLTRKYILKKLMEGKLPNEIIYRKKKGFGTPLSAWISGELKPMVQELLGRESITKIGLFNPDYVQTLLNEHFTKKKDNRKEIWTLMVFVMWWNQWMK